MELRQLRCFVAVAEELHFGRAAKRLNLSQPPLTRTIQQLEAELGVVLLERTKRRVELAPAGKAFLAKSKRILSLSEEAVAETRRISEGLDGTLSVSFVGSAMYVLLPAVLREMHDRYPGVEINLHEMATDQQVSALLDYRTQAAFIRPGIVHPMLRSQLVLREDLAIALPRSHPLADRRSVSLRQIAQDPFILFPRQTHGSLGNRILDLCAQQGFAPGSCRRRWRCRPLWAWWREDWGSPWFPAGSGICPGRASCSSRCPSPSPTIDLSLAHHRDETSPILGRFLEIVLETASQAGK